MTFRRAANIDANQHKGLILLNSISGSPLVATGVSLTNSQPMHVAVVDTDGSQITPSGNHLPVDPYLFNGTNTTQAPLPFLTKPFDQLVVTYTDNTKTVISSVVTKRSGVTQETLTNTVSATVDDFLRT